MHACVSILHNFNVDMAFCMLFGLLDKPLYSFIFRIYISVFSVCVSLLSSLRLRPLFDNHEYYVKGKFRHHTRHYPPTRVV